jgi:hypothetical protein
MRFWSLTVVAASFLSQASATNVEHVADTYDFVSIKLWILWTTHLISMIGHCRWRNSWACGCVTHQCWATEQHRACD